MSSDNGSGRGVLRRILGRRDDENPRAALSGVRDSARAPVHDVQDVADDADADDYAAIDDPAVDAIDLAVAPLSDPPEVAVAAPRSDEQPRRIRSAGRAKAAEMAARGATAVTDEPSPAPAESPQSAGASATVAPFFVASAAQLVGVDEIKEMTGLDFIAGVASGRFPSPPICQTLNFKMIEAAAGRVVFEGEPLFEHYNPLGAVHGGWFGALLDSCMACAVQTRLPRGYGYTTLEYRVNIVRPLHETSELVHAVGEALHVGKRTGAAEGKLIGVESGKLYAFGTTTCLVMEL